MPVDEFEIIATGPFKLNRSWTRSSLESAKYVADAVVQLGFTQAKVFNIFGGDRSEPIYTATSKTHRPTDVSQ